MPLWAMLAAVTPKSKSEKSKSDIFATALVDLCERVKHEFGALAKLSPGIAGREGSDRPSARRQIHERV
jgi:hypothetical protein